MRRCSVSVEKPESANLRASPQEELLQLQMISFDSKICKDFTQSSEREWLETNGIGGFASGTISGANTRRYHGLLTAALQPPVGRFRLLSKFEECLIIDGERYEFSANQYPGAVFPQGYIYLKEFRIDPFPVWTYEAGGITLEKSVFMPHGVNAVTCNWRMKGRKAASGELELRPLLSFVDFHSLEHSDPSINQDFAGSAGFVSVQPFPSFPRLFFKHNAQNIERTGYWYRNFEYEIEKERGFDFLEDLFQPFLLRFDLKEGAWIIASTDDSAGFDPAELEREELKRRKALTKHSGQKGEFLNRLVLAADQFIVKRGLGNTIIAGYPWFSDWGRDTMIALHGLTLTTNRAELAREILLEYLRHISEGMLPNRFPDAGGDAEYNTVDAALWYFEAIRAYSESTGDFGLVRDKFYDKLADILAWHLKGTRHSIHLDTDGLLYAGEPGLQLTWMDAKIGDFVVTPRIGKPVEIQALWYNALRIMAEFAERFGHDKDLLRFNAMADLAKLSFNALFWNKDEECLYDTVENGRRDSSIRPNQIFAVSLPFSMLETEKARLVVKKVESELLTPFGLRSLSPRDPAYIPKYEGSPIARDSAYHQGTVWAWLIGPFIDAYLKVFPENRAEANSFLSGFEEHLRGAGVGQISEIFDAEPPHIPRGCPAQAWSVAEVLRVAARLAATE